MKGEFRKGDVIVRIGGQTAYVVEDAHTDRYSIMFLIGGNVSHLVLYKTFIDRNFVKVDKCNPNKHSEVVDKIKDIWYNVSEGETRNGGQL